jgi:hypothetical protein
MPSGLYKNISELNNRCKNMNKLPPVLRKLCISSGRASVINNKKVNNNKQVNKPKPIKNNKLGMYGNIREMNNRCKNMSKLSPVLKKFCVNSGRASNKNNRPTTSSKGKWQTAGKYATMYNKPQAGNRMKWATNGIVYKTNQNRNIINFVNQINALANSRR